jgi:hypothetical protein
MTGKQAFTLMRAHMLTIGYNPQTKNQVTDSYLFAWQESVYPLFHQDISWHKPFADHFDVGAKHLEGLWRFLDAKCRCNELVTFYDLEETYHAKGYPAFWTRERLVKACRYMHLRDVFNAELWEGLLALGGHPSEASRIDMPMQRKEELVWGLAGSAQNDPRRRTGPPRIQLIAKGTRPWAPSSARG